MASVEEVSSYLDKLYRAEQPMVFELDGPCQLTLRNNSLGTFRQQNFIGEEELYLSGMRSGAKGAAILQFEQVDGDQSSLIEMELRYALKNISGFRAYYDKLMIAVEEEAVVLIRKQASELEDAAHLAALLKFSDPAFGSW